MTVRLAREEPALRLRVSAASCSDSTIRSPRRVSALCSAATASRPRPRRAVLTWRRFLQAHGRAIPACDYFVVDTVFLKRLYVPFSAPR